jgi:hypothetical protein
MIAQLLMGLLADAVFRWASWTGRGFQTEVDRYMERQGLVGAQEKTKKPATR